MKAKRLLLVDALRKARRSQYSGAPAQLQNLAWRFDRGFRSTRPLRGRGGRGDLCFSGGRAGCSKVSFCQSSSCHCKGPFRVCYHRRAGVYSYARAMEDMLRQLQSGLARSQPSAPAVVELQLNQAKESGWGDRTASPELPPGLDPGLARQALQSGISHAALGKLAKIAGRGSHLRGLPTPKRAAHVQPPLDSEEQEEKGRKGRGRTQSKEMLGLQTASRRQRLNSPRLWAS